MSTQEAYRILNLNPSKSLTKEEVNKAYIKIQKKIHPDVSPETSRLSSLVNEAKEIVDVEEVIASIMLVEDLRIQRE